MDRRLSRKGKYRLNSSRNENIDTTNGYIIFEDSVHSQVFFVQATEEMQAWKLYLERQWEYVEQSDGTYRHKVRYHKSLNEVFGVYGIISNPDGSYFNVHGATFSSLQEVQSYYSIKELSNEMFTSQGVAYFTLAEAKCQVAGHHHLEIAPCCPNLSLAFQTLFVSRDKWEYAQLDTADKIKEDIHLQHLWQAVRYETLGELKEAIAELKQALHITPNRREQLSLLLDVGRLLEVLDQLPAAARYYQKALGLATEFDNRGAIRYGLAEVYERMGQLSKALWHYKRVSLEDLDDEDNEKITGRITELEQSISTTKTA